MRILFVLLFLTGCATTDNESISRDRTTEQLAKAALIGEMLKSQDPVVRSKGAEAATEFVKPKEKSFTFRWGALWNKD